MESRVCTFQREGHALGRKYFLKTSRQPRRRHPAHPMLRQPSLSTPLPHLIPIHPQMYFKRYDIICVSRRCGWQERAHIQAQHDRPAASKTHQTRAIAGAVTHGCL